MRPSEFEAIRPHLQEAFDRIDADLKRSQALKNDKELHELFHRLAALPEGTPSKVKPRVATDEEKAELSRSFRCTPLIQDAYPWRHIATQAAVWLRDAGWITEAKAIGEVLSGLPTGPVDGNQPGILNAQFDAIRAGAERIRTILTTCLAGGPSPQGGKSDDASAVHPQADQDGADGQPPVKDNRKASINARMIDTLQKQPEAKDWTIKQWIQHLGCKSKASVAKTKCWETIMGARAVRKVQRLQQDQKRTR